MLKEECKDLKDNKIVKLINENLEILLIRISEYSTDTQFKEGLIISSDEEDKKTYNLQ